MIQAPWLEPCLAAGVAALVIIGDGPLGLPWYAWLANAALIAAVALSDRLPRTSLRLLTCSMLSLWLIPPDALPIGPIGAFVLAFSWVARRRPAPALVVGGITLGVYLIIGVKIEGFPPSFFTHAIVLLSALTAVSGGLLWQWVEDKFARQRDAAETQLHELRVSLARDLHDTVAQTLSHASMRAWMAVGSDDLDPDIRAVLVTIAEECAESATDLRRLLSVLREHESNQHPHHGPLADAETLTSDLASEAQRLREAGFEVETAVHLTALSAARATTMSRILHEAVSNILKHASDGSPVTLSIVDDGDVVRGTFTNRASSGRLNRKGWGIVGMEERLALVNGRLRLDRRGGLWSLHIELPANQNHRVDPNLTAVTPSSNSSTTPLEGRIGTRGNGEPPVST